MLLHSVHQLDGLDCVLDHPRTTPLASCPPMRLRYTTRKRARKQGHKVALHEYIEELIVPYEVQNGEIIYLNEFSELLSAVGRGVGHGMFFGGSRDVVEPFAVTLQ